jgi:hypothetical protein
MSFLLTFSGVNFGSTNGSTSGVATASAGGAIVRAAVATVPGGAGTGAAQIARPDSDITPGLWTFAGVPAPTSLFDAINETVGDDNDYITNPTDNTECMLGLSDLVDPNSSSGHIMRWRDDDSAGQGANLSVNLYQGVTSIALSIQPCSSGTFGSHSYTLTANEANSITDYSDLRVVISSDALQPSFVFVSWFEFEVPGVAGAGATALATGAAITFHSGDGSSTGVATVSGVGDFTVNGSIASASGVATVSGQAGMDANASGVGAATGVGRSTFAATASSTGVGTVNGQAGMQATSAGTSTVSGQAGMDANTSGVGTASGTGASTAAATASSSGTSTAIGTFEIVGSSSGTSTVNGQAGMQATTSGLGAATGVGISTAASTASSSGVATVNGQMGAQASASGVATVNGQMGAQGVAAGRGMPSPAESYDESNSSFDLAMQLSNPGNGQLFTSTFSGPLTKARFHLAYSGTGTRTGTVEARLYATSANLPTGSPLATSTTLINASDISSTTGQMYDFDFSPGTSLTAGTKYAIVCWVNVVPSQEPNIVIGLDNTSPTHPGNRVWFWTFNSTWQTDTNGDIIFELYLANGVGTALIPATASSAGVATVDGQAGFQAVASGIGTATATGQALQTSGAGSSSGVATVDGQAGMDANASGVATTSVVGSSLSIVTGVASSTGSNCQWSDGSTG